MNRRNSPLPSCRAMLGLPAGSLACLATLLVLAAVGHAESTRKNGFDLSAGLVAPEQILRGGPPKDGIPAIDDPVFIPAAQAWLSGDDRVIGVEIEGDARAYPIAILNWHEIVNDTVGGEPIAVTFCPLCGTGIVFSAQAGSQRLTFGVSGLLYNSDVLLYDRQSESLWSQILSKAVTGKHKGDKLKVIPSRMTTWSDWLRRHPGTVLLSRSTGHNRDYGNDPYAGYLESSDVFFPVANSNGAYHPKEIVVGVEVGGRYKAYPVSELEKLAAEELADEVNGLALDISWDTRNQSAGVSAGGENYPFIQGFWFAWYAFHPETEIFEVSD